eukprot:PhM_4_TR13343/c0_g1_i1/m.69193
MGIVDFIYDDIYEKNLLQLILQRKIEIPLKRVARCAKKRGRDDGEGCSASSGQPCNNKVISSSPRNSASFPSAVSDDRVELFQQLSELMDREYKVKEQFFQAKQNILQAKEKVHQNKVQVKERALQAKEKALKLKEKVLRKREMALQAKEEALHLKRNAST